MGDPATNHRADWWILGAATVAGIVAGALFWTFSPATYTSTATLTVSACLAVPDTEDCDPVVALPAALQRSKAYAVTAQSGPIMGTVSTELGLTNWDGLPQPPKVRAVPDAPLIEISVESYDADLAAKAANLLSTTLIDYAARNIDNIESTSAKVLLSIATPAESADLPTEHSTSPILLGAVLGALVGGGAFLIRRSTRRRTDPATETAAVVDSTEL